MSIVKGASGNLKVSADLVPNWDYSIVVWYKVPSNNFSWVLDFINDSSTDSRIYLRNVNTYLRHRLTLVGNRAANTSGGILADTWTPIVIRSSSSDGLVKIDAVGESVVQANPLGDSWIPPSDPALTLFETSTGTDPVPDGSKVGALAFYSYLSDTDTAHIISGGAMDSLPSETAPIEYWLDSTGIVKDGSNNLTSWTGINGTALTPSGTVTVDDADLAPVDSGSGPSITDTTDPVIDGAESSITTDGLTGTPSATLGGYSLTLGGTLPNLTYTTDIAAITDNGPFSCPRIGDNLTLSVTGDEGTVTSTVGTSAKTGWAVVELAGTLSDETDSLIDKIQTETGLTVAVTDILYYATANSTSISTSGSLTTDAESIPMILIQGGDADTAGNGYALSVLPPAADAPSTPTVGSIRKLGNIGTKHSMKRSMKVAI